MITHLAFATLYVADQQETLDFFVGTLGFTVRTDAEMAPGKRWLEVELPGARTRVVIAKAADFGITPDPKRGAGFNLACDDVMATHTQLAAAGASVSDPVIEPWGSFVTVSAPDGMEIMISQADPA
ncbi:VOC family protein [Streptomyces sp. NPDC059009]|uniref:VOC family protein n=1 Tax=Streptomyces sp. NPDC059009 TaxID=3346694 RepID=UPI0036CCE881